MSFMSEVRKYLASRKDVNKAMNKAFKVKESYGTDKNHETPAVINMLKELDAVTVAVLNPCCPSQLVRNQSQAVGHQFPSQCSPKEYPVRVRKTADTNELEKVDAALNTHKSKKSDCGMQVENVQIWLQDLEANIQDIEGLECLFNA